MRSFNRGDHEARPISFELDYTKNATSSVLVCFGETKVICTAFLEDRVPPFLKNQKRGWVSAEYGMLPGSTNTRTSREAKHGRQNGRTVEISRLIGRTLRTSVDHALLGERTITIDCDVIQADGGTRTASITGGGLAIVLCLWRQRKKFPKCPLIRRVAAVSVGLINDAVLVDLDYNEDSAADVDLNLVMANDGRFIEIQGTAEKDPFSHDQLSRILKSGGEALNHIHEHKVKTLLEYGVDAEWIQ